MLASSSMSLDPLPPPATSQHTRPLRFHPPTSAPHLHLNADHLTASHTGPGNHTADHSLLHADRPITFGGGSGVQQGEGGVGGGVDVFYFEVKLVNAGKRGEIFVGLITGDSPAIDPQLVAAIKEGKLRDGQHGNDADVDEEVEEEMIEIPAPQLAADRLWQHNATSAQSAASLSQPAAPASSTTYSSSAQRQLGLEHPHSFSIQLTHGRLYSVQHAKGLSCLPSLTQGDTLGIGYVHNALSSTAAPSAVGHSISAAAAVAAAATSTQPLPASSLIVSSYVFFTKNGRLIPDKELNMDHINTLLAQTNQPLTSASTPVQPPLAALLFPAISFHSPNESIQATFHPPSAFLFDVAQYEAELRDRRWQLLAAVEDGKSGLLSLVREYLLYWGYDGTVAVLDENEVVEVDAKLKWTVGGGGNVGVEGVKTMAEKLVARSETSLRSSLRLRGEVRQLIQRADVQGAVRRLRHECPAVLRQRLVRFHLHSLQFINILTTQQPTTTQSTLASSSILAALQYARQHLSHYLHSAFLSRILGRLMALLPLPASQWSNSRLTGVEWREHVADVVNTAILLQLSTTSETEVNGGGKRGNAGGGGDRREESKERRQDKGGKHERQDSDEAGDERSNGMEVEDDELFGMEGDDGSEQEEEAEEEDAETELHGSQLEMLFAQLLAVNSLWQHQRPSLSNHPLFPRDDVEQLLTPH